MKLDIAPSDGTNYSLLLDLQKRILPADYPLEPTQASRRWIVKHRGKPVGFGALSLLPGRVGFLSRSGVLPAYRGHGTQQRLIKMRIAAAKKMKLKCIVSDTSWTSVASTNSLIACGFRAYVPKKTWRTAGQFYWRLNLEC